MYAYLFVSYVHPIYSCDHREQKRESDLLELELHAIMSNQVYAKN